MDDIRDMERRERRDSVEALDEILGVAFRVLDHGFVRVVDYMGSDRAVIQAARVSYGKGTRSVSDDTALIRYLLRKRHTTPFEMCELKLHVKLPIFVARQWIRHRTASVNEYSGRYSVIDNEFYVPAADTIAAQSSTNRQGRGQPIDSEAAEVVRERIAADAARAYAGYEALLAGGDGVPGLSRELARIGLGVNVYTQWYWKSDLHNLLHFLQLRADPHAQYEIRQYAERILEIVERWVPMTYAAFRDFRLGAATLSAQAIAVVRRRLSGEIVPFDDSEMSRREWDELERIFPPDVERSG